jgi:hypothetical protein
MAACVTVFWDKLMLKAASVKFLQWYGTRIWQATSENPIFNCNVILKRGQMPGCYIYPRPIWSKIWLGTEKALVVNLILLCWRIFNSILMEKHERYM